MGLKERYTYAVQVSQGVYTGRIEERDGKLHWDGWVATEGEKNRIWDALKTIPEWKDESRRGHPRHWRRRCRTAGRAGCRSRRRSRCQNLHGETGRHARQDCQGAPRQRQRAT